jgi:hypothetical protein
MSRLGLAGGGHHHHHHGGGRGGFFPIYGGYYPYPGYDQVVGERIVLVEPDDNDTVLKVKRKSKLPKVLSGLGDMVSGVPNWVLLLGAGAVAWWFLKKRR